MPVRAQRHRLPPRHLPRARRRGRGDSRRTRASARVRVEFFGDEIEALAEIDPLRGKVLARPKRAMIYPASHYVTTERAHPQRAVDGIRDELARAPRRAARGGQAARGAAARAAHACYDLEMLEEMGFCHGIENYSRWLDGRAAGRAALHAARLLPRGLPRRSSTRATSRCRRSAAMYRGDRARKETLVEFGFRLPSALDNRPLRFEEWESRAPQAHLRVGDARRLRARAHAAAWSWSRSSGRPAWSIRRSRCGRPRGQVDDLLGEIRTRVAAERARAGHDAHQAHGRGADRVLRRARRARALPAQRHRDASSASRSSATCARASSTCWSASTCCARASTCPRCRWSRSSTRTRKASCAPTRSLIQTIGRAARNVNGTRDPVRRQADRLDPRARSTRRDRRREIQRALQRGARHHAADGEEAHLEPARLDLGGRTT